MFALILNTAKNDDRIREVIMNGSYTNSKVLKDIFME
ncbi:aminoglycoside 6-adenylyltransferase [Clostridium oryzae]